MAVVVITPAAAIVSLAEAKEHLRVDASDEDTLIEAYLSAAAGHIDGPAGWLGRALGEQELELRASDFGRPGCGLRLPCPPILEVLSVSFVDPEGAVRIAPPSDYTLTSDGILRAAPGTAWPATQNFEDVVRVRYRAGYEQVPKPVKAAILLMVGDLYAHRETGVVGTVSADVKMSTTVENLLAPYRVWSL